MRLTPLLGLAALLAAAMPAWGKDEAPKADVERDLKLELKLLTPAQIRPGEAIHVSARLLNQSKAHGYKLVRPGNGCQFAIVEPHVFYTARVDKGDGVWQDVPARPFHGMCGMGDYHWQKNVVELEPGGLLDFSNRLSYVGTTLLLPTSGRIELRLHYAYRAKGTRERLPSSDPVGQLGPMEGLPPFEIVSEPVVFEILGPIEIVAEAKGILKADVATRLSDLLSVRLENRTLKPLALDPAKLKIRIEARPAKAAKQLRRKPLASAEGKKTLLVKPSASATLLGTAGFYDEAWIAQSPLEIEVRGRLDGYSPGAPSLYSPWIQISSP